MSTDRLLRVGEFSSQRVGALEESEAACKEWAKKESLRRRTKSHRSYRMPHRVKEENRKRKAQSSKHGETVTQKEVRKAKRGHKRALELEKQEEWLATHQWSSKRMAMGVIEGKKVPQTPRGEGIANLLRKSSQKCTICDLSFYSMFHVSLAASKESLADVFHRSHASVLLRKSVGFIELCGHFGTGRPICPLWFAWGETSLWIWFDSRGAQEMKESVQALVDAAGQGSSVQDVSSQVDMFRLRGQGANAALFKAFGNCLEGADLQEESHVALWQTVFASGRVRSPASIPEMLAVALSLNGAQLERDALAKMCENDVCETVAACFNQVARTQSTVVSHQLSKMLDVNAVVPVLLVRSTSCGWDIIMPARSSHSRRVWQRLVFAGAAASGIINESIAQLASGGLVYPQDFPGTTAYDEHWQVQMKGLEQAEKAKPLGKRIPNPWPLAPAWESLSEGQPQIAGFAPESSNTLQHVQVELQHVQPSGAKARIEVGARIFLAEEQDIDAWKLHRGKWNGVNVSERRELIGFVTSALGVRRVYGCSLRKERASNALGNGLVRASIPSLGRGVWVLVLNRSAASSGCMALGRVVNKRNLSC